MQYYFSKTIKSDFNKAIETITQALKEKGFGIITEIDIRETFRKKLDVDFRPYRILGACNPHFAHQALQVEDKIGAMLPCNVIVQDIGNGQIEIAAVDPIASMSAVDNEQLGQIAEEVRDRLKEIIQQL